MQKVDCFKSAHCSKADTTQAVDEYMSALDHPRKAEVQLLREIILAANPSIHEGIKWNAPSFRRNEYFATTNLRAKAGVGLILHLGAKVRDLPTEELVIEDTEKLLKWLAKDRATIEFSSVADIENRRSEITLLVNQWILLA